MFEFTQYPDKSILAFADKPQRIVSLVPSVTEAMIDFGVMPVGRTSFCIEPSALVSQIPRVGGTKTPNIKRIVNLSPDLVIANYEENTKQDVESLQALGIKVWVTYPEKVQDTLQLLQEISQLSSEPKKYVEAISAYETFLATVFPSSDVKVLTLIWKDPWMAVGQQTYPHHVLEFAGGVNACKKTRYPVMTEQEMIALNPDVMVLPSEPYAFDESDVLFWQERMPGALVIQFCGEDLFWSGERTILACQKLARVFVKDDGRHEKISI